MTMRVAAVLAAWLLLPAPAAAADPAGSPSAASSAAAPTAPPVAATPAPGDVAVRWIPRTFPARPESDRFVERIRAAEVGESFLLTVEPQVRTPAEGPWRMTLARDGDPAVLRLGGLRVDGATGQLAFLVTTAAMPSGSYLLVLEVEEGGLALGPAVQSFRFAIE